MKELQKQIKKREEEYIKLPIHDGWKMTVLSVNTDNPNYDNPNKTILVFDNDINERIRVY